MTEGSSFLQELDEAITKGTHETRLDALWHVTDVLISGQYNDEQIWLFGEIIQRLAEEIEQAARVKLATRLASVERAPLSILDELASSDSIDIAGPVLRQARSLSTNVLLESARTKSQQHLLAISQRASIPSEVTDVLVVRGDKNVVNSVAKNSGAAFSKSGFLHLLRRAENDTILAESIGARSDVPRHIFQQLIAKASSEIKLKLQAERPDLADEVNSSVTDVTGTLHLKFGPASRDYFAAKRLVGAVFKQGHLNEAKLFQYASVRKMDEVVVGLSLMTGLPVNIVERSFVDTKSDLLLILARATGLSWTTTMSLLFLSARDHKMSASELERNKRDYDNLSDEAAKSVVQFYQSRKEQEADEPSADVNRLRA